MMATSFWGADGKPLSSGQFLENLFGTLPDFFKDEDELRTIWGRPDTRKALLEGLFEKGYGADQLAEIRKLIDAEKSDLFDVLAYVAFALQPITREKRVSGTRDKISSHYEDKQQAFIDFVLSVYVKDGVGELDQEKLPKLLEIKYHAIDDAVKEFGSIASIRDMFVGFQRYLYEYRGE